MSEVSILSGVTRADIRREPFAHIVIENCLPETLYRELSRTFPTDETILRMDNSLQGRPARPNSRHDVGAQCILKNPDCFSASWRAFVGHHVSNAFFREFVGLMGQEIAAAYPDLERRLNRPLSELRTGILHSPEASDCDVALDCHIGINTPSRRTGSVRRVHTDAPDELFAALLYFRSENDQAAGGDLEIFQWKPNAARRFVGSEVEESDVQRSHTVAARGNTAVVFVNTSAALHAVSARHPSIVSRRLVNIMGRVPRSIPEGLFVKRQKAGMMSLGRRALQRVRMAAGQF